MNVILTASTFIFPLITFPYISRILLPAGVGKVNFATSLVSYFSMIAMLGVPTYGIRACAQVRDDREELSRTVHEIFFINLIMGVLVSIVYFAGACDGAAAEGRLCPFCRYEYNDSVQCHWHGVAV